MNRLQRGLILAVSTKDWQVRLSDADPTCEPPHLPAYPDLSPLVKALAVSGVAFIEEQVRAIQTAVRLKTLASIRRPSERPTKLQLPSPS
jgi:hypothetical protein